MYRLVGTYSVKIQSATNIHTSTQEEISVEINQRINARKTRITNEQQSILKKLSNNVNH